MLPWWGARAARDGAGRQPPFEVMSTIVVGIDFTATTSLVLHRAAMLAKPRDGRLLVVHAVDEDDLRRFLESHPGGDREVVLAEARERVAKEIAEVDLTGIECEIRVEAGSPVGVLAAAVKAVDAKLLIMSAHDVERGGLGSTASRSVRKVPCHTLLVRDWHDHPYRTIAACIDFSETSRKALDLALDVAEIDGSRLEIVHVIYPPDQDFYGQVTYGGAERPQGFIDQVFETARAKVGAFAEPFADRLAKVDHEIMILASRHASNEIMSHVRNAKIELVAIGTTGKKSLFGLLLGSNAERLISDAPCSVLAVKPA